MDSDAKFFLRRNVVQFSGREMVLAGRWIRLYMSAPNFTAVDGDMAAVNLSDCPGTLKVIFSFPSFDTLSFNSQLRGLNQRTANLSQGVRVICVSRDLPFFQKRYCVSQSITDVTVLSDHPYGSFGFNYGLYMKELGLLATAVLIVDQENIVRYIQIAPEAMSVLDQESLMNGLSDVLKCPSMGGAAVGATRCRPCEMGTPPLDEQSIQSALATVTGWTVAEGRKLRKEFILADFVEAKLFLDVLSAIAQEQGHHPSFSLVYRKVVVTLTTHTSAGLTENDFIMARIIDEISF